MRFTLHLAPQTKYPKLMWNYAYPLSAWLYGVIANADSDYASFLHNTGYHTPSGKSFKHFTFSDFRFKMGKMFSDGFEIASPTVQWTVSFLIDKTAESFIIGLFQDQRIRLFNRDYDTTFIVERVETLPELIFSSQTKLVASSAMVVAEKVNGKDQYLEPTHEHFGKYLLDGLIDKYISVLQERGEAINPAFNDTNLAFKLLDSSKMKSRKVTIKEGKDSATEIRGFRNFQFELTAPSEIIKVGLFGGLGKHSAAGFGYCEVVDG
ncbi:CRISPR-associated endoribonuclease Cas6 [Arcicella aquatica]|uniref:CRISPR-associated endoribonuclease n=1 Tax=Arcicella aquatica TaxID=217141 RepID=A0ABU5QII6_9BACT|nr:CRISPR-associated endoribonuclease Cas6 [Arcicella aquatica]MEA5256861.1 CRISPR-associated endoribonuclease Cas6 [Arcicella aquatica]